MECSTHHWASLYSLGVPKAQRTGWSCACHFHPPGPPNPKSEHILFFFFFFNSPAVSVFKIIVCSVAPVCDSELFFRSESSEMSWYAVVCLRSDQAVGIYGPSLFFFFMMGLAGHFFLMQFTVLTLIALPSAICLLFMDVARADFEDLIFSSMQRAE